MAEVEIYTTLLCPYCWPAKRLLRSKGVAFVEIDLWREPQRRAEMVERAGGRTTVPQVFVDGRAIGGSDELAALERVGCLDPCCRPAAPRRGGTRPCGRSREPLAVDPRLRPGTRAP